MTFVPIKHTKKREVENIYCRINFDTYCRLRKSKKLHCTPADTVLLRSSSWCLQYKTRQIHEQEAHKHMLKGRGRGMFSNTLSPITVHARRLQGQQTAESTKFECSPQAEQHVLLRLTEAKHSSRQTISLRQWSISYILILQARLDMYLKFVSTDRFLINFLLIICT